MRENKRGINPSENSRLSRTLPPHPCEQLGGKRKVKRQTTHLPIDMKVRRTRKKRLSNDSYFKRRMKEIKKPSEPREPFFVSFGNVKFF